MLEKEGIALRGLFIIDPNGILRQITINDLPIGRSVSEILRLLEALQFVEKHGEGKLCCCFKNIYMLIVCLFCSVSGKLEERRKDYKT